MVDLSYEMQLYDSLGPEAKKAAQEVDRGLYLRRLIPNFMDELRTWRPDGEGVIYPDIKTEAGDRALAAYIRKKCAL